MLLIMICSIVILESCLSEEVFDNNNSGLKALHTDDVSNVNKRWFEHEMWEVVKIYDAAIPDTWSLDGVIPHPKCHVPFAMCHSMFCFRYYGNYNCKSDSNGAKLWCSTRYRHVPKITDYHSCIMKGTEVANPRYWKPHIQCSELFALYNRNRGKYYYYKGCTTYNSKVPWCAYGTYLPDHPNKWSHCTDITPKWGKWGYWTVCSQTCSVGKTVRNRKCFDHEGKKEVSGCPGFGSESKSCFLIECAAWSVWTNWFQCSKSCNNGLTKRTRQCFVRGQLTTGCDGESIESKQCYVRGCPGWTQWDHWSCSKTCGYGRSRRTRKCLRDGQEHTDCPGEGVEEKVCHLVACIELPIDGVWSEWGPWATCSKSCNSATTERLRWCNNPEPKFGGQKCVGMGQAYKKCYELPECETTDTIEENGGFAKLSTQNASNKMYYIIGAFSSLLLFGILIAAFVYRRRRRRYDDDDDDEIYAD